VGGELPPNSSDEEEGSGDDSESEDDDALLNPNAGGKRVKAPEPEIVKSQKEIDVDMGKLALIREKREADRVARIAKEARPKTRSFSASKL